MIIEILGRPKENVSNAMKTIVDKLSSEKGVKLLEQKLHEPVPVEDAKDLFTTFSEILVEFDSPDTYFWIMFAYMPSNMQVISPEKISITNVDLTVLGNRLIQRLHDYDAVVKKTLAERDMLARKLHEVAPHLFKKEEQSQGEEQKSAKQSRKSKKQSKKKK